MSRCKIAVLCGVLAGCAGAPPVYVQADRATFDAIAPVYSAYVEADPTIDPELKARRLRTVETWRMRVEAAEGAK